MNTKTKSRERYALSARELMNLDFPKPRFYVDQMITTGLTVLAGKPKKGKSWLVLQLALDIARGAKAFGTLATKQAPVIYYALEDSDRRVRQRSLALLGPIDRMPKDLSFHFELSRIDEEALIEIEQDVKATGAKIVFIDTISKIRKVGPNNSSQTYQHEYEAISSLHTLATRLNIAMVFVFHARKSDADDAQDAIHGSVGLLGAVDSWFVLRQNRDKEMELVGGGRDIEGVEWAMHHNSNGRWEILGELSERRKSDDNRKIQRMLDEREMTTSEINTALGRDATKLLFDMSRRGEIRRVKHGVYAK